MAIKNASSGATTVKSMMQEFPNDAWSIDHALYFGIYNNGEAIMQVQDGILLDRFRAFFEDPTNGYIDTVTVPEDCYYMPSLFAERYYGDAQLDFLVLYFAKIPSALEFDKPSITVLRYDAISLINTMFVRYRSAIEDSKANPTYFAKAA